MEYFEVKRPGDYGLCSDHDCSCDETRIPSGSGYLYISQAVVDYRRNCCSVEELERRISNELHLDSMLAMRTGVVRVRAGLPGVPILMCEPAARRRELNLRIARLDAEYWWRSGHVPYRPTPKHWHLMPTPIHPIQPEKEVLAILKKLTDEAANIRLRAVDDIRSSSPDYETMVRCLAKAMEDESKEVRLKAVEELYVETSASSLPWPSPTAVARAVRALVNALTDEGEDVRCRAADTLGHFGLAAKNAVPALIGALKDTDEAVRDAAALSLGGIGPQSGDSVDALNDALRDESENVRRSANEALQRVRNSKTVAAARQDAYWPSLRLVNVVHGLMKSLENENKNVRWIAADTLGQLGPAAERAVPALISALRDTDEEVRISAAISLGEIGPKAEKAANALAKAIKSRDKELRRAAVNGLAKLGWAAKKAAPTLIDALKDEDEEIRRVAASCLAETGMKTKNTVDALTHAAKDQNELVRCSAAAALQKIQAVEDTTRGGVWSRLLRERHALCDICAAKITKTEMTVLPTSDIRQATKNGYVPTRPPWGAWRVDAWKMVIKKFGRDRWHLCSRCVHEVERYRYDIGASDDPFAEKNEKDKPNRTKETQKSPRQSPLVADAKRGKGTGDGPCKVGLIVSATGYYMCTGCRPDDSISGTSPGSTTEGESSTESSGSAADAREFFVRGETFKPCPICGHARSQNRVADWIPVVRRQSDARFHSDTAGDQSEASGRESHEEAEQGVISTTEVARVQPSIAVSEWWQESCLRFVAVDAARYLGRAALLVYLVMTPLFLIGFGEGSITRQMLFSWPAGVIVFGSLIGATVFVAKRPVRTDPKASDTRATGESPFADATDRNSEEQ